MDGMILAAGLGSRLLPVTENVPKALIEVGGMTLLERSVRRLAGAGCDRIVVNVHHRADHILEYLELTARREPTGPGHSFRWHESEIILSLEEVAPLETGGGILHAGRFFRPGCPTLVHNVDVISDIDLPALVCAHQASGAVATLAVSRRDSERYLVFDREGLCGRVDERRGVEEWARLSGAGQQRLGFAGIHVLTAGFPSLIAEVGAFSILTTYLRLAASGHRVLPHDVTGALWLDVGTPERLEAARARMADGAG